MKSPQVLLLGLALATSAGLHAQTVVQTVNFNETATYTTVTGSVQLVDSSYFTGTFDPFDDALGTLDSFVIEWTLANTGTGNLGGSGGSISLPLAGALTLNGDTYQGDVVDVDAAGGPPNTAFALSVPITESDVFLVSGAGVDYDLAFLDTVTGEDPFTLAFTSSVTFSVSGSTTFDAATIGNVTLTYHYTAASVPEPATAAALAGLGALTFAITRRRR